MRADETPQTWRCHLTPCPTRGEWQTARGETAEDAWEYHLKSTHGAVAE